MNFLPISILAYGLNAGSIVIDKILLQKSLPNAIAYVFYINILGFLTLLLIPFGFSIPSLSALILAIGAGITFVGALYAMFSALKQSNASLVGPVVGSLNPLFTALIGALFGELLSQIQYMAIAVLIAGACVLSIPMKNAYGQSQKGSTIIWMVVSGFLFAVSYLLLRQTFLQTSFINGLIISRVGAAIFVGAFLLIPSLRTLIFQKKSEHHTASTKTTVILLGVGQTMGALQGLLLTYATSLANPALVNSLFGVQYIVILLFALILHKNHPDLLQETINSRVIVQKFAGVIIVSVGLYLLAA